MKPLLLLLCLSSLGWGQAGSGAIVDKGEDARITLGVNPFVHGGYMFPRGCESEGTKIYVEGVGTVAWCSNGQWVKTPDIQIMPDLRWKPYPWWRIEATVAEIWKREISFEAEDKKAGDSCKVVPAGDGCNTCTECPGAMGGICTALGCSHDWKIVGGLNEDLPQSLTTPEPVDVPAIQEDQPNPLAKIPCGGSTCSSGESCAAVCLQAPPTVKAWTCADPKRILLTSVDGTEHWCHKVEQ